MTDRKPRKRSRASARAAGARLEITTAKHLRKRLETPWIDRQPKNGAKDMGDIAGVTLGRNYLAIECKNTSGGSLTAAHNEAVREAANIIADGRHGDQVKPVVIHKRHGVAEPGDQWVTMTVDTLIDLIIGTR